MAQNKKLYHIEISGESGGSCDYWLTRKEYHLIETIFNLTKSEYCGGIVILVPTEEDIVKLGKGYNKFIKEEYYLTFRAYYHDIMGWNYRFYDAVEKKLKSQKII